jgi:Cu/Ag efflux pump CusA
LRSFWASAAGAEMRQSLGTAVLFGMMGVTCFGLVFTPAFYTFIRNVAVGTLRPSVFAIFRLRR